MQGVNGLYTDTKSERKEAFARLEQLRRKGTVTDDDAEFASCRGLIWNYRADDKKQEKRQRKKSHSSEGAFSIG